jgi:hypothetical protein
MAPAGKVSMTNLPALIFLIASGRILAMSLKSGIPVGHGVAILHLNVLTCARAPLASAMTAPAPRAAAPAVFKKSRLVFFIVFTPFF